MAKQRKNQKKRSSTSKSRSKNTRTRKKRNLPQGLGIKTNIVKSVGPVLLSLFVAYGAYEYRGVILNWIHQYNCVESEAGDFGAQTVYNAINIQHQIRENPNKKNELMKLLNDEVIWFRKSRKKTLKNKIRTYSKYDSFCYAKYPIYDVKDDFRKNYEMRFIGYHRFREIDSIMVKVENYYCKLENGKISEIYSIPMNSLDKESFENVNNWYNRISVYVFFIILVLIYIVKFIIRLPEGIFLWIKELVNKYLLFFK